MTLLYTGLIIMFVGVLSTWDSSIGVFLFNRTTLKVFVAYLTHQRIFNSAFTTAMDRAWDRWWSDATRLTISFSRWNPMYFLIMGLHQGSGLCSSCSRKYPGTEGTNQNRHWNHHRWHATNSLEQTRLSCWCL